MTEIININDKSFILKNFFSKEYCDYLIGVAKTIGFEEGVAT